MCGAIQVRIGCRAEQSMPQTRCSFTSSAVTLMVKDAAGARFPVNYTVALFSDAISRGEKFTHMSKRGVKITEVHTLDEAMAVSSENGDYILRVLPNETLTDDVSKLKRNIHNVATGLEQQTTRAIERDAELNEMYGKLTALAGGHSIIFRKKNPDEKLPFELEVDGIVVNSVYLLANEVKQSPKEDDVVKLLERVRVLRTILSDPSSFVSEPFGCMALLSEITQVVPVMSGYNFMPQVVDKCREKGVHVMRTNGLGHSA